MTEREERAHNKQAWALCAGGWRGPVGREGVRVSPWGFRCEALHAGAMLSSSGDDPGLSLCCPLTDVLTCDPGWPRGHGSDEVERSQVPPAGPRQTQLGLGLRGWQGMGGPRRVRGACGLVALPWGGVKGGGIRTTCGLGMEQRCRGASTRQLRVSPLETVSGDVKPVVWL